MPLHRLIHIHLRCSNQRVFHAHNHASRLPFLRGLSAVRSNTPLIITVYLLPVSPIMIIIF